jgi:hypothetical protein
MDNTMLIKIGRLLFIPGAFFIGYGFGVDNDIWMIISGLFAMAVSFYINGTEDSKDVIDSRYP